MRGALLVVFRLGVLAILMSQQFAPSAEPGDDTAGPSGATTATDVPPEPVGATRPERAVAVTVDYIHDGDTLFIRALEPNELLSATEAVKVRLIGIDTPEIGDAGECFGAEATGMLRAMLPEGGTAWVTADRDATDRYGRILLYAWTGDGRFVNHELVAGGAANSILVGSNDAYYPLLRAAEDSAARAGVGMWGAC